MKPETFFLFTGSLLLLASVSFASHNTVWCPSGYCWNPCCQTPECDEDHQNTFFECPMNGISYCDTHCGAECAVDADCPAGAICLSYRQLGGLCEPGICTCKCTTEGQVLCGGVCCPSDACVSGQCLAVPPLPPPPPIPPTPPTPPACGDLFCDPRENCGLCPVDCGLCSGCGDGYCDCSLSSLSFTENFLTCPQDCGLPLSIDFSQPGYCGDSWCASDSLYTWGCGVSYYLSTENCSSCPDDCGSCEAGCGNLRCDPGEDCASCPTDCGGLCGCGNRQCEPSEGENCLNCEDCACSNGRICNGGVCSCPPETVSCFDSAVSGQPSCVSPRADPQNCGGCSTPGYGVRGENCLNKTTRFAGQSVPAPEACWNGNCGVTACTTNSNCSTLGIDYRCCGTTSPTTKACTSVNSQASVVNCGACGTTCGSGGNAGRPFCCPSGGTYACSSASCGPPI